jgi:hypothetical protein
MLTVPTPLCRMAKSIARHVATVQLDLQGLNVLTEAATGAYRVTPVIAAVAGAQVTAFAKGCRYGSVEDARTEVLALAQELRVSDRIQIVESLGPLHIGKFDIVTNTGHLRPLDGRFVAAMKRGAAIPLMYEQWELRSGEVDLNACRERGIQVAGTNECHPAIRVFDYLGNLALLGLSHCRVATCFSKILLICDNPFAPHIARTLIRADAELEVFDDTPIPDEMQVIRRSIHDAKDYDAIVVASTPTAIPVIGRDGHAKYSVEQIGTFGAVVQLWGDVDRSSIVGSVFYPSKEPPLGHMGVLLSELGAEPVIRLQTGGLKVGEVLAKSSIQPADLDFCQRVHFKERLSHEAF